jgi:sporulation integral membrane protein YtvI
MQNPKTEQRREFVINVIYFAVVTAIVFLCLRYVARWIMPFIIGYAIALTARPAASGLTRLTKMNRKVSGILVLLIEYAAIFVVIWVVGSKIFVSLRDFAAKLPEYYDKSLLPFLSFVVEKAQDLAASVSPETLEQMYSVIENSIESIRDFVINISSSMVSGIAGLTKKVPFYFISFAFTILASVFISMEYDGVVDFAKKQMPDRWRVFLSDAKKHIGKTVLGYLRAYIIIWVMTFTELSIGLSVLQIENSVGIAAIIAVADILPVIGTGSVLIPWSIVALFMQNYFLAAGLIILYIVVLAVRNFTEPKIVGDQLGLNPIVTLISIYLGYRIMGFGGMILLPVATNILVGLHKSGKIKLWKE